MANNLLDRLRHWLYPQPEPEVPEVPEELRNQRQLIALLEKLSIFLHAEPWRPALDQISTSIDNLAAEIISGIYHENMKQSY